MKHGDANVLATRPGSPGRGVVNDAANVGQAAADATLAAT